MISCNKKFRETSGFKYRECAYRDELRAETARSERRLELSPRNCARLVCVYLIEDSKQLVVRQRAIAPLIE